MDDPIRSGLNSLREKLAEQGEKLKASPEMAEALRLLKAANAMEELVGDPPTSLSSVLGLGEGQGGLAVPMRTPYRAVLEAWEFTGKKPLEAAKLYLKKAGQPKSISDIVNAINTHGGTAGSVEHLKTSLTRATLEVVKVSDDMYGLVEHFPHIKRRGKPKKGVSAVAETEDDRNDSGEEEATDDSAD